MAGTNSLKINKDLLYAQLRKRGVAAKEASRAIGYSENYIAQACNSGVIGKPATILIEQLFEIPYETYSSEAKKDNGSQIFNCDDLVAELKELRGINKELSDTLDDIRYVVNILAQDLKIIREELAPTKDESEVDNV